MVGPCSVFLGPPAVVRTFRGWSVVGRTCLVRGWKAQEEFFVFCLFRIRTDDCSPLHAASGAARAWVPPSQRAAIAPDHHLPTFDVLAHRTR